MRRRRHHLEHEFVDCVPAELRDGVMYICMNYGTVVHRCCCGCGEEVVTPLTPTDWTLVYNGEAVSLDPSIGNWSFDCESHYWIEKNRVRWASKMSKERIRAGRAHDRQLKQDYFAGQGGRRFKLLGLIKNWFLSRD